LRSGRCRKGHEDILRQRLAENHWRELLVTLSLCDRALILHYVEVLQGSRGVENPPASERPATDRSDDVRGSVRNDLRLDGERKHQQLCEGTSECKPVGAGGNFIRSLTAFASSLLTTG